MTIETIEKKGKGTVFVQPEICKGCSFCIELCPTKAIAFSKGFNQKGYHFPIMLHEEKCSGCNLCGLFCPDYAIFGIMYKDMESQTFKQA